MFAVQGMQDESKSSLWVMAFQSLWLLIPGTWRAVAVDIHTITRSIARTWLSALLVLKTFIKAYILHSSIIIYNFTDKIALRQNTHKFGTCKEKRNKTRAMITVIFFHMKEELLALVEMWNELHVLPGTWPSLFCRQTTTKLTVGHTDIDNPVSSFYIILLMKHHTESNGQQNLHAEGMHWYGTSSGSSHCCKRKNNWWRVHDCSAVSLKITSCRATEDGWRL